MCWRNCAELSLEEKRKNKIFATCCVLLLLCVGGEERERGIFSEKVRNGKIIVLLCYIFYL